MKDDRILSKATRFIGGRRYGDAIRLLEPEVVRYHESFRFHFLLAQACLRSGDFGGALTYFRRAREIKMREPAALLGLAVLYLRRGETDRAVELYLEVLEKEPKNGTARRALQVIRKMADHEALSAYIEAGKLERLYPRIPRYGATGLGAVLIPAALVIAAGLGALSYFGYVVPKRAAAQERFADAEMRLENEDKEAAVETGGAYRYILTKKQVIAEYDEARRLFVDYRDEAAKLHINRLLDSNASVAIKRKARLLADYAAVPGFDTIKDRFPYAEILKDPALFRDVHVVWRGMATNLREGKATTDFELLVGYDTRSKLEGIVPVRFEFSVPVDVERPLEVLGKIAVAGEKIRLEGVSLHQASTGEGK